MNINNIKQFIPFSQILLSVSSKSKSKLSITTEVVRFPLAWDEDAAVDRFQAVNDNIASYGIGRVGHMQVGFKCQ